MTAVEIGEAIAGGLLFFVVPGYAVTRAMFPEWRLRGPGKLRRGLETATLSFVLSIGLTVLVGYALLSAAPGGFAASWSDPLLEVCLAAVAAAGFVAAALQGAFSRSPTPSRAASPEPGGEGAWELTRELDRLHREERRLRRSLRSGEDATAAAEARRRLEELGARVDSLERAREDQYAQ